MTTTSCAATDRPRPLLALSGLLLAVSCTLTVLVTGQEALWVLPGPTLLAVLCSVGSLVVGGVSFLDAAHRATWISAAVAACSVALALTVFTQARVVQQPYLTLPTTATYTVETALGTRRGEIGRSALYCLLHHNDTRAEPEVPTLTLLLAASHESVPGTTVRQGADTLRVDQGVRRQFLSAPGDLIDCRRQNRVTLTASP